eukprot:122356-Chlamydomonas_euryale.AAC.4
MQAMLTNHIAVGLPTIPYERGRESGSCVAEAVTWGAVFDSCGSEQGPRRSRFCRPHCADPGARLRSTPDPRVPDPRALAGPSSCLFRTRVRACHAPRFSGLWRRRTCGGGSPSSSPST